jgi:predicted DNA-binding protein
MKSIKKPICLVVPVALLKKIDRLAKKAGKDRSKYICAVIEAKMFADEMKAAYGEAK